MVARPLDAAKPSITILAGIVLLGVVLSLLRSILIPIALAVLLSFTLSPACLALQRRGMGRASSVLLVAGTTVICVAGAVVAISYQLHNLASDLPRHKDNIVRKIRDMQGEGPGVFDRLAQVVDEVVQPTKGEGLAITVRETRPSGVSVLRDTTGVLISTVGTIGLLIALTMAMLFRREDLRNRLIRLVGHGELTSTTRALDDATRRISRYLQLQLAINAVFGVVFGFGMLALGVSYPLLWGILAFLVRFVPLVGTWLAALFPLVISFAASDTWLQPISVVVFTVIVGMLVNNVVEPMLISRSTGVSPVGLVIAAALWTWLWGPIGLVLSTPITVCLAVLGKFVPALQFLDVLFGTDPALDPQDGYYQRLLARDEDEAAEIVTEYVREHNPAELCDKVLIPTLVRAKEDRQLGHLTDEDLEYIVNATQVLTDDMEQNEVEEGTPDSRPMLIGCPAKDSVDELSLRLFQDVLGKTARIRAMSVKSVVHEITEAIRKESCSVVLLAAVHPGGLARLRYLIKRLRAAFPALHIEVGYWGLPMEDTKLPQQLSALGATQLGTSMAVTLQHLETVWRVSPHLSSPVTSPSTAPSDAEHAVQKT